MIMNEMEILKNWFEKCFGQEIQPGQLSQFEQYLNLLQEWNKRINLTTITETNDIIQRHFIDSLTCLQDPVYWLNSRVLDMGAGAGFPGIPLKIIRPDLEVTLVETVGKKAQFLETVVKALKLANINIINERAEALGQDTQYREKYDVVISRALAKLPVACEFCLPLVKTNRVYQVMLGEDNENQLETSALAIKELGGKLKSVRNSEGYGTLVLIEKIKPTPTKYPRKPGIPAKRPLIQK